MLNLEAIEKRYEAGSPAKEDIPDLIAEVKRLQGHRLNNAKPSHQPPGLSVSSSEGAVVTPNDDKDNSIAVDNP